jgi:hypothetical protein
VSIYKKGLDKKYPPTKMYLNIWKKNQPKGITPKIEGIN